MAFFTLADDLIELYTLQAESLCDLHIASLQETCSILFMLV